MKLKEAMELAARIKFVRPEDTYEEERMASVLSDEVIRLRALVRRLARRHNVGKGKR
jgi:hypothetical protein